MANENYEGFDLTIYNLFTLLREMYYTRGETETNFLSKSGGTLGGSLTIQGNLTVQGNSYKIDTEDLVVKDYTITLAKDNEQALLSMVGMVVPKYDGTNYGFFGWDADGYAYVGDLTNYDGSSAITLANNSSLQRISTIDTTNTVVASNGVIYVYDATSHCFKRPTNDNKYYVIRNGAFVETELFTEQKSKNIDNALYNVGAFDSEPTVSNGVVSVVRGTRQEVFDGSENWVVFDAQNYPYLYRLSTNNGVSTTSDIKSNLYPSYVSAGSDYSHSCIYYSNGDLYVNDINFNNNLSGFKAYISQYKLIVETQLSTTYTDKYIEGTPNIVLDQNMANKLREKIVDGLNLYNGGTRDGYYQGADGTYVSDNRFFSNDTITEINDNTTYNIKISGYSGTVEVFYYDINKSYISKYNSTNGVFTTPNNAKYINFNTESIYTVLTSSIMLVKGTNRYPFVDFNQKEHITNDEATLLKQEEEKCRNLLNANYSYSSEILSVSTNNQTIRINGHTNGAAVFVAQTVYLETGTYYISTQNLYQQSSGLSVFIELGGQRYENTSITVPAGTYTIYLRIDIPSASPKDYTFNIMLNKGSTAQPYQPYNGEIVHKKDIEPVLLWENSSPNSAFAGQDITIKDSSSFKYLVLEMKRTSSSTHCGEFIKIRNSVGTYAFTNFADDGSGSMNITSRSIYLSSTTSVHYYDGILNNASNNDANVPIAIYGTNVL